MAMVLRLKRSRPTDVEMAWIPIANRSREVLSIVRS